MPIASFEEESKLVQETAVSPQNLLQGMSGWLVKKGLASNQTSADLTLLVLAGFVVIFSFGVYFVIKPSPGSDKNAPSFENLQRMQRPSSSSI